MVHTYRMGAYALWLFLHKLTKEWPTDAKQRRFPNSKNHNESDQFHLFSGNF
jgi:hypothetical protein